MIVTGGASFIGSTTCEGLTNKGFKVVVVDNLYSGSLSNVSSLLSTSKVAFVKVDVSNPEELTESLSIT